MRCLKSLAILLLALALVPVIARAQPPARSFGELQAQIKVNQTVVVTERSGQRIEGRVTKFLPESLVLRPAKGRGTRVFAQDDVTEIWTKDSRWNGLLIGAAVGSALATWDYLIDPSEPGNGAIFTIAIGLGSLIGAGIDSLSRGKLLYVSSTPRASVVPDVTVGAHLPFTSNASFSPGQGGIVTPTMANAPGPNERN